MVLTAPMRAASGSRSSRKAITDSLCGIVTLAPRMRSSERRPAIATASSAGLTSRSTYSQSMRSALKAAFCITGERLRETGSPSRSTLFMGELLQLREEVRIGDSDAVRVFDRGRTGGDEGRHRQRHGNAVIPAGVDGRALQRGRSLDADAVRALFHDGAHAAKAIRHGGDPVALLDAELPGTVDRRDALSLGRQHEQDRDLVDGGRHLGGPENDGTKALRGDGHHSARLDITGRPLDLDVGAHRSQQGEERGPGWVETDVTDDHRPARAQL